MGMSEMAARIAAIGVTEDAGRPATDEERAKLVSDLSPVDGLGWIGEDTEVRVYTLPFYTEARLVVAADASWKPTGVLACWLWLGGDFWRLDGRSAAIHDLNSKSGLVVEDRVALPYMRFFCFFVRGEEGPFFVLDERSLPLLPEAGRDALAPLMVPPELLGRDREGALHAAAFLQYGKGAFAAHFRIQPTGMVEMLDDDPLDTGTLPDIDAPLSLDGPHPDRDDDEIPF
jgi:hypothetical protein